MTVKVDSGKTLALVTKRFMKANRGRNIIAVMAIIMTTVMFMALFTSAVSVLKSKQASDMRRYMDSSHISVQDMTEEEFERVKKCKDVYEYGYTIFMTTLENKETSETQTEVRFADEKGAAGYNCLPSEGRMPEEYDEVAMSTITLKQLGISPKIGEIVTLTFTLDGKKVTDDFRLCGYWDGDTIPVAQMVWLSRQYCLANTAKAGEDSLNSGDYEGGYNISIWCRSAIGLEKKAERINSECGFAENGARGKATVNPAYDLFGEDGFPAASAAMVLLVIFAAGYLIIYNVFRISVNKDVRIYGLLKNIGTTGRQIRKIVRRQAWRLSLLGIPIGLAIGLLLGRIMTPMLLANADNIGEEGTEALLSVNPLIFIFAALFSLATVYIGCIRPCRIVAGISPVEAVRMTEEDVRIRKVKSYGKAVTASGIAVRNIRRTWKKAVLVIISMALPIVVLNSVYTIVKGFDYDAFLDIYINSDIDVSGNKSLATVSDFDLITPEFMKAAAKNDDIETAAYIYDTEMNHRLSDIARENMESILEEMKAAGLISGQQADAEAAMIAEGIVPAHVTGINKTAFEKMSFSSGSCSWDEFSSGNYVIAENCVYSATQYYSAGDEAVLEGKSYQVIANGAEPFDFTYQFGSGTYFDVTFYLPEAEYISLTGNENAMTAGLYIREGSDEAVLSWLSDYSDEKGVDFTVDSREEYRKACEDTTARYAMIGGALCVVLFVIGILNFINSSAVSVMTRKHELALLEAVGMSKKQIRRMLMGESVFYIFAAVALADTAGTLLASRLIPNMIHAFFFTCDMSVLPSLCALPLLLAAAVVIPAYNYGKISERTVVERLAEV